MITIFDMVDKKFHTEDKYGYAIQHEDGFFTRLTSVSQLKTHRDF